METSMHSFQKKVVAGDCIELPTIRVVRWQSRTRWKTVHQGRARLGLIAIAYLLTSRCD